MSDAALVMGCLWMEKEMDSGSFVALSTNNVMMLVHSSLCSPAILLGAWYSVLHMDYFYVNM